jgi:hypothetical protein
MSTSIKAAKLKRTINGRNIQGDERVYTFNLMDSKTAYNVFHEFSRNEVALAAPVIVDHLSELWNTPPKEGEAPAEPNMFNADELPLHALQVVKFFPLVLTFKRISELNELMLANATVAEGENTIQFDKDGFAKIDPLEMYNALLYAIVANYEPLIPPLLLALEEQGEDDTSEKKDQA